MKINPTWLTAALVLLQSVNLPGQGTVHFGGANSSLIINSLSGKPVSQDDGIKAALYWSPLGSNDFVQIGPAVTVGVPLPGLIIGGTRSTGPETPGGGIAQFQVRA